VINNLDDADWGKIELAFIDLDKTAFVTEQHPYCPHESDRSHEDFMKKFKLNVQLWHLAKKFGVDTFIATGNNPPMVQGKFMEPVPGNPDADRHMEKICTNEGESALPAYAPGIYMNGAYVVDTNGKVIVESKLNEGVIECINGYLADQDTDMGISILNPSDILMVNNKRSSWPTAMKFLDGFAGVYSMAVKPEADGMQRIKLSPVSKDKPATGKALSDALEEDDSLFAVSENEEKKFPKASAHMPYRLAAVDSVPKDSYDIIFLYDASVSGAEQLSDKDLTDQKHEKFKLAQKEVAKLITGFAAQEGTHCSALDMPISDVTTTEIDGKTKFSVSFGETKKVQKPPLQYKLSLQDVLEFHITIKGGTKGDAMQKVVEEMNKGRAVPLTKENVLAAGDADNDKPLMMGTSDTGVLEENKIVPGVRVRMPWAKDGELEVGPITNVQMSLERAYKNIVDAKELMSLKPDSPLTTDEKQGLSGIEVMKCSGS